MTPAPIPNLSSYSRFGWKRSEGEEPKLTSTERCGCCKTPLPTREVETWSRDRCGEGLSMKDLGSGTGGVDLMWTGSAGAAADGRRGGWGGGGGRTPDWVTRA